MPFLVGTKGQLEDTVAFRNALGSVGMSSSCMCVRPCVYDHSLGNRLGQYEIPFSLCLFCNTVLHMSFLNLNSMCFY